MPIVFQKINIYKKLTKQLTFFEIQLSFSESDLRFLKFICDFLIFNWEFSNTIRIFWNTHGKGVDQVSHIFINNLGPTFFYTIIETINRKSKWY